jgi:hypothetical protein
MNALILTVFCSAVLLVYGLVQFVAAWSRGEHLEADRLALLPLADDLPDGTGGPGPPPAFHDPRAPTAPDAGEIP